MATKLEWRGETLRDLRTKKGWSQAQLVAELAPYLENPQTTQTISTWERSKYAPSGANLVVLAKIFKVEPTYFFIEKVVPPVQPTGEGSEENKGEAA